MSGHRRTGKNILWRCYIPEEVAVQIELLLADPLRAKPTYGARSQLVTTLLIKFLSERNERNERNKEPNLNDRSTETSH